LRLQIFCFLVLLLLLAAPVRFLQATETQVVVASEENEHTVNAYRSHRNLRRPAISNRDYPTFNVTFDFDSQYIWRGIQSSLGAVWQPSASIEYKGFGLSLWMNLVMDSEPNQGQINEIDITPYYALTVGEFNFVAGLLGIAYPNGNRTSLDFGKPSLELDLHASYPLGDLDFFTDLKIRFISGTGSLWWDFGLGYQSSIAWNFAVNTKIRFALGNDTFNRNYFGVSSTLANQFEFSLSFPWKPCKGFTLTPYMHVSSLLAPSLRRAAVRPDIIWGGGTFSYDF